MSVTPEYFRLAHAAVFEIGVKLAQVLWRKLILDQREQADKSLMDIGYDLLVEEKYGLAKATLDFSTDVIKQHMFLAMHYKVGTIRLTNAEVDHGYAADRLKQMLGLSNL